MTPNFKSIEFAMILVIDTLETLKKVDQYTFTIPNFLVPPGGQSLKLADSKLVCFDVGEGVYRPNIHQLRGIGVIVSRLKFDN